jgi:ribosomal protein S27AE
VKLRKNPNCPVCGPEAITELGDHRDYRQAVCAIR